MPGEKNTFGLPSGEPIRLEMLAVFRDQRLAILGWMDSEGYKVHGLPDSWPSWDQFRLGVADVASRVRGAIADIWERAGKGWLAANGLDPKSFDVTAPAISAGIDSQAVNLAANANATTTGLYNRLLEKVKDLFNRGKLTLAQAIAKLRGDIRQEIRPTEVWRARRIAVTEASRAFHAAMVASAYRFGTVTGWRWKTAEGACPLCLEIEAEAPVVELGQPFAIIGTGEYSVIEHPPAHPNCMCTLEEVWLSDDQPDWSETLIDPQPPRKKSA